MEATPERMDFDRRSDECEALLKPLLTPEFLRVLRLAVKVCGWEVDHIESRQFVEWCHSIAAPDAPLPELGAFDYDDLRVIDMMKSELAKND